MNQDLVKKYARAVPRYTSYPTAPHFSDQVDETSYANWLARLDGAAPVSLYAHIPFCDTLCWYCGCTTKMVRRYNPVRSYMTALLSEIELVAARCERRHSVSHVHLGGGSPSILDAADIHRLNDVFRANFDFRSDVDFAIEIDPRYTDFPRIKAFLAAGITRVSLGVQDFAENVQAAINRFQSFEQTSRAIDAFRDGGVNSVNIDLVYGLPHQTCDSVLATMEQVLALAPDRIALFGYAHLPSRLIHQRLIDESALPDAAERLAQSTLAAECLVDAGYIQVGLDHFARPGDSLVTGRARRNFQGYTSDTADTLIGFGASAIGHLPQGYIQNVVPTGDYIRRVTAGSLATARGIELTGEDRVRGYVINALMCDMAVSIRELESRFGVLSAPVVDEIASLAARDNDGLVSRTDDGVRITERGRPFVRSICAQFDTYLAASQASYSAGV
jgi:oxygen-independent coproporphyrinogen-3 oxidase